jgi:hypothetical protein
MSETTAVGLDPAKYVFQVHGADVPGRGVLRKKLRRDRVLPFFSQLARCVVAMEACSGAHFWGREIGKPGHELRLILPAHVQPLVKRQKDDAADAEAICEAAMRPTGDELASRQGCDVSGLAVTIFLPRSTPLMPGTRINRSTVQRATSSPSRRKTCRIFRAP